MDIRFGCLTESGFTPIYQASINSNLIGNERLRVRRYRIEWRCLERQSTPQTGSDPVNENRAHPSAFIEVERARQTGHLACAAHTDRMVAIVSHVQDQH